MRRVAFLLVVVSIAAGLGLWIWKRTRSQSFANFPPTARGPWVAYGDSLTEGVGATEGHTYPDLLSQKLGIPIRNLGINGLTTASGLDQLSSVTILRPRVVLLCLGGNDALQKTSQRELFLNLSAIIDELHQQGTFVVLLGVRSATLRDQFPKPFAALAREKRALYIPNILDGVVFNPELMSDAVHPNDAGYARIADRIYNALRPYLKELTAIPESPPAAPAR